MIIISSIPTEWPQSFAISNFKMGQKIERTGTKMKESWDTKFEAKPSNKRLCNWYSPQPYRTHLLTLLAAAVFLASFTWSTLSSSALSQTSSWRSRFCSRSVELWVACGVGSVLIWAGRRCVRGGNDRDGETAISKTNPHNCLFTSPLNHPACYIGESWLSCCSCRSQSH